MNIFEKIFRTLNTSGVKYMVVGGVAVNLYGYVRFTGDLDLLILLDEENLKKMDAVMRSLKYCERLPVSVLELRNTAQVKKWIKEKNLKAFSFVPQKDTPLQIDIIIEESLKFDELNKKKTIKKIGDVPIPVVSLNDLIKMKKKASRDQQTLKHWKRVSTRAKLEWLESALYFGKLKRFK